MFKTIEGATDCEIRSVIRFLNARNVLPSESHHHICQVYGDNAMSHGMIRKCVRMFNEGRENVHDEARKYVSETLSYSILNSWIGLKKLIRNLVRWLVDWRET